VRTVLFEERVRVEQMRQPVAPVHARQHAWIGEPVAGQANTFSCIEVVLLTSPSLPVHA
jgi:hypothetical protein